MAGGGTGGHVIPALAVARELRTRGREVFFVGTERGMEAKLVPAGGFELKTISIGGLNRVGLCAETEDHGAASDYHYRLLSNTPPAAVFSMGGYVAGPPVLAALMRRTPVVVMEPNAIAGFTNRLIGRFVSRALVSFEETARFFPPGRTEVTGLPVREEFFRIAAQCPLRRSAIAHHRRQPGVAHAQPRRAPKLAALSQRRFSRFHHPSDRRSRLRGNSRRVREIRARRAK